MQAWPTAYLPLAHNFKYGVTSLAKVKITSPVLNNLKSQNNNSYLGTSTAKNLQKNSVSPSDRRANMFRWGSISPSSPPLALPLISRETMGGGISLVENTAHLGGLSPPKKFLHRPRFSKFTGLAFKVLFCIAMINSVLLHGH